MRWLRRLVWTLLALAVGAAVAVWLWAAGHGPAQLDLAARPGIVEGRRLVALGEDFPACRALLDRAGVRYEALPARRNGPRCGYGDGVRFGAGGSRRIAYSPASLGVACPVAAALAAWEWTGVQPAALRHFGRPVAAIETFGSYNCRRMYGRDRGSWSEHATADAVDIAAFRLTDGRRISINNDWRGDTPAGRFLREVRAGACPLFATVLSPDYNAAHRDHLHLDQANRGVARWRACR